MHLFFWCYDAGVLHFQIVLYSQKSTQPISCWDTRLIYEIIYCALGLQLHESKTTYRNLVCFKQKTIIFEVKICHGMDSSFMCCVNSVHIYSAKFATCSGTAIIPWDIVKNPGQRCIYFTVKKLFESNVGSVSLDTFCMLLSSVKKYLYFYTHYFNRLPKKMKYWTLKNPFYEYWERKTKENGISAFFIFQNRFNIHSSFFNTTWYHN